jgi:hypothetical protein
MYLPTTLKGTLLLWILALPSGAEPGRDPEEEDRDVAQPDGMGPSARPDGPGSAPRRSGRRRRPPKWFY